MDVEVYIFPVFQKSAYFSYPELRLIYIANDPKKRAAQPYLV
jgi:hypothetical protein